MSSHMDIMCSHQLLGCCHAAAPHHQIPVVSRKMKSCGVTCIPIFLPQHAEAIVICERLKHCTLGDMELPIAYESWKSISGLAGTKAGAR